MALAAINSLNGIHTMRGCDQPLTVRFADPKRPRPGDSRSDPAYGGLGFGPRFQRPGPRPPSNLGDPMPDRIPHAWHPMSPQKMGPLSNPGIRGFGNQLPPRSGYMGIPLNPGGPADGPLPGVAVSSTSFSLQQNFNQPRLQVPSLGQQISPLQKPLQSAQHMPPSLQLRPEAPSSYAQTQTTLVGQLQILGQTSFSQALPSQHLVGISGQFSASQPQVQQIASSSTALPTPLNINLQSSSLPTGTNRQQLPAPVQQQLHQHYQQSPSHLAQMMSQQTQTLQTTFLSSQQAFSQLQQQPAAGGLVSAEYFCCCWCPPAACWWAGVLLLPAAAGVLYLQNISAAGVLFLVCWCPAAACWWAGVCRIFLLLLASCYCLLVGWCAAAARVLYLQNISAAGVLLVGWWATAGVNCWC